MKKYQKILIGIILSFFILSFVVTKTAQAKTREEIIEEIKAQIAVILVKIAEIQKQINELKEAESAVVKSITLLSPNGLEKWEAGKTSDIKWNSSGYLSDSKVKIKLLDARHEQSWEGGEINIIDTTNTGVYSWKIPDLLNRFALYGSLYKIAVSIGEGSDEKTDTSDNYFIISQAIPAYFNLISPNGGEIWQVGKTYTIKWDSLGMENYKISIVLKKSDMIHLIIAENISNKSFYNWKISQGLYGADYKILINIYDNNGNLVARDSSSNNFTIIQSLALENIKTQLGSVSDAIGGLFNKIKELIK